MGGELNSSSCNKKCGCQSKASQGNHRCYITTLPHFSGDGPVALAHHQQDLHHHPPLRANIVIVTLPAAISQGCLPGPLKLRLLEDRTCLHHLLSPRRRRMRFRSESRRAQLPLQQLVASPNHQPLPPPATVPHRTRERTPEFRHSRW